MNKIIESVNDLELVKKIHSLEEKIDNNEELKLLFNQLKNKQKQMVNAKEFEQWNQYGIYKKEYEDIYNKFIEYPAISEYVDLLDIANDIIENICFIIEKNINSQLQ